MDKRKAAGAAAVLVIIASVVWMLRGSGAGGVPEVTYFYDLGTEKLFEASRTAEPPIDAPSGAGRGVRAIVFSCGDCTDAQLQVAFLVNYTEGAKAAMTAMPKDGDAGVSSAAREAIRTGSLVGRPAAKGAEVQWFVDGTPQADEIKQQAMSVCGGKPMKTCYPD